MNLVAIKNIQGVLKIIERANDKEGLSPKLALPGDVFSVRSKAEADRLIKKGAAREIVEVEDTETQKPVKKAPAKKAPAKKTANKKSEEKTDDGEGSDDDLGL